jgi:hypothetical protein
MAQFLITYHGGNFKPETPEAAQQSMDEWQAWATGLGSAIKNPGSRVGITKVLTHKGISESGSPHPSFGFTVIEAESIDAALDLLTDCPHIKAEGMIEVSEMLDAA